MPNGDLSTIYSQLCESYRAIDDFRTKLLGFLPLVTGTGIFLLLDEKSAPALSRYRPVIGTFGFIVTLGLFLYEIYGIKKCHALIRTGQRLEPHLITDEKIDVKGQFLWRGGAALGFIHEGLAASIIYPAALAAWFFLALSPASRTAPEAQVIIAADRVVVSSGTSMVTPIIITGISAISLFIILFLLSRKVIHYVTEVEIGGLDDKYEEERKLRQRASAQAAGK